MYAVVTRVDHHSALHLGYMLSTTPLFAFGEAECRQLKTMPLDMVPENPLDDIRFHERLLRHEFLSGRS